MLQKIIIMLIASFVISNSTMAAAKESLNQAKLTIYNNSKSPLLLCQYTLTKQHKARFKDKAGMLNELKIMINKTGQNNQEKLRGQAEIHPLYPVFSVSINKANITVECLFMLPAGCNTIMKKQQPDIKVEYRYRTALNSSYNPYNYYGKTKIEFIDDKLKSTALQAQWKNQLQQKLINNLEQYENTELETLLYLRFFNSIPAERPKNWKSDNLAKLIFNISGLNDIRDAVPLGRNKRPLMEKQTLAPPTPIILPPVKVTATKTKNSLAQWIPRSCYYVEWQNLTTMHSTLSGFATLFDRWSPGTYPLSADKIMQQYLNKLGLTANYLKSKFENNIESIVLAGWDPYYQSGTSIMMVIKTKKAVTTLPSAPYVSSPADNIILLSTSNKLYKMALNAHKKQRSLSQLNNFAYSRQRLATQKDEQELSFIYLSDYWLTNFISPRWQILNNRLAELDARLRLVYLLKLCRNYETYPNKIPNLTTLKNDPFLSQEFKNWLFASLEETNGIVGDKALGSLYNHPPIDQIPFKKVTPTELSRYNNFKRIYSRRWQQIDPIALQLIKNDKNLYKTRLYISPISNRSKFRSFSNFVAKQKPKHALEPIAGKAIGLSIAIPTPPLRGFGIQAKLPLLIFVQLAAFDLAPSSYSPTTWLQPKREYDQMSYMRIPAALSVPAIVLTAASRMTGNMNFAPSPYKDIEFLQRSLSNPFAVMRLNNSETGLQYFSLDPATLGRIRDSKPSKPILDTVPCDIRLSVDLVQGYQLRRKLWFEALKNRGLASWRRANRLFRMSQFFSSNNFTPNRNFPSNNGKNVLFPKELRKRHIFPVKNMVVSEAIVKQIPLMRDITLPKYQRSSNIIREAKKLPELLQAITGLELFISVEPNALFFETHYHIPQKSQASSTATQIPGQNRANQTSQPTTLDFDE